MYPVYRDIPNWVIVDEAIIHDFTANENPIRVVNVLIGTLHYKRENLNGYVEIARTPITRWMTIASFRSYQAT